MVNRAIAILLLLAGNAAASEGARFDLFGRPIEPTHLNLTGSMPPGELKLVLDPRAPRFGSKKRLAHRSKARPEHVIRLWQRPAQQMINVDQAVAATHLVKSGGRLILRHY